MSSIVSGVLMSKSFPNGPEIKPCVCKVDGFRFDNHEFTHVVVVYNWAGYGSLMEPRKTQVGPSTLTVASNITRYRKRAGYSMRGLADEMSRQGFPMSHSVISQMENGARRIDVDELSRLAFVLDCPVTALLTPHDDDPEARIGTSARERDTALVALRRIHGELTSAPEWVQAQVDMATGATWRHQLKALDLAHDLAKSHDLDDADRLLTFMYGIITRERALHIAEQIRQERAEHLDTHESPTDGDD